MIRCTICGGSEAITQARGDFWGRSSRSRRMFGSSASWKPRRESVSMQTGTERSFEYVASSGESLRR